MGFDFDFVEQSGGTPDKREGTALGDILAAVILLCFTAAVVMATIAFGFWLFG